MFDPAGYDHLFTASMPDREDAADWYFDISVHGIVAYTQDPDMYYKAFLIE